MKEQLAILWWSVKINWKAGRWLFLYNSVYNILNSSLFVIISSYLAAQLTSGIAKLASDQTTLKTPLTFAAILVLIAVLRLALNSFSSYISEKISANATIVMTDDFLRAINNLNQEQLDDETVQEKITIADNKFYAINDLADRAIRLIGQIFSYFSAIIVLMHFTVPVSILLLALTPLLLWSGYKKNQLQTKSWEDNADNWRLKYSLRSTLTTSMDFFQLIVLGARKRLFELWKHYAILARDTDMKAKKRIELISIIEDTVREVVDFIAQIWLIVYVAHKNLSFSEYLFGIGLAQQAVNATWMVSYQFQSTQDAIAAGRAGKAIITLKPIRPDGKIIFSDSKKGVDIQANNLTFSYKNGVNVINDVTFHIKPGERVAIVGENGAGKTTILKLLLGQYKSQSGNVNLDDQLVHLYKRGSIFTQVSALMQEFKLFEFLTVRQNIVLASRQQLGDNEIFNILDMTGLSSIIKAMPKGLDTPLDASFKDGVDLSGGQKQRLAIARCFAKSSRLIVLDEPTSAVDAKAEKMIFDKIFSKHSDSTMIIVSHRFSTVRKADRIFVISNGSLIEQGSHEELIKLNGHYAELYNLQAKDYKD